MKRNVLIILIVFSTMDLFSQIGKGNSLLSIDGNYMKLNTESGVTTNRHSVQGQYLDVGPSIGYFVSDRFAVGVGVDYYWDKEARINSLFTGNTYAQQEEMTVESKALLPNFYLGYYSEIVNRLYFSTNLKLSYGNLKTEENSMVATAVNMPADGLSVLDPGTNVLLGSSSNSRSDYFAAKISPELTWLVTGKFALNMGLGGIAYTLADWKSDNSGWAVNFNPNYWRLGIKFML